MHSIGRGLPQGGVLSPLLRLVYFNDLPTRLAACRAKNPTVFGRISFKDLICADDITTAFACQDALKIPEIAGKYEEEINMELALLRPRFP